MESDVQTMVRLSQEIVELKDVLGAIPQVIRLKECEAQLQALKDKMATDPNIPNGKQEAEAFGHVFSREKRKPAERFKVTDIDLLPEEFRDDEVLEDAIIVGDGGIFLKANEDVYAKNGVVLRKRENLDLIKAHGKLGEEIPGVEKSVSKPYCILKIDGRTI